MLKSFLPAINTRAALFLVHAVTRHSRVARFSSSSPRFTRGLGSKNLAIATGACLLGASLATYIFDNPFSRTRSSSSPQSLALSSPLSSAEQPDPKRVMYRALMLRGMACRPFESKLFPEFERSVSLPENCEKARETLRALISGSAIAPDYVYKAIDQPLQNLALAQAQSIAFNISNSGEGCVALGDASVLPVKVAPSTVQGAGLGVIATRFIPEGSIVTFYGGEILNKAEISAFGSETPPASPFSPRHTIDCGLDFVLDGFEFARADCPAFLCGSVVNHPPKSSPPNTAFLTVRAPVPSNILSMRPRPISFDSSALYFPATSDFPSANDVPVVVLVTILPVQPGQELFVDYNMRLGPSWCRQVTVQEIAESCK